MKTYLAEWKEGEKTFCVSFDELSDRRAENLARKRGWVMVGELVDEVSCPDDVFAMIEKRIFNPVIH